jgi:hypothetical protein
MRQRDRYVVTDILVYHHDKNDFYLMVVSNEAYQIGKWYMLRRRLYEI